MHPTTDRARRILGGRTAFPLALAAVLGLMLTGCTGGTDPAPPSSAAPEVTVSGSTLPLAGKVPFLGVIRDPTDPAVIVVQADLDRTIGTGTGCVPTVNRPVVQETADEVVLLIAAYGRPPSAPTGCDGEGDLQPIRVRLASPLGDRRLVDRATGTTHPVLVPSTVPTIAAEAHAQAEPLRWDDRRGVATRRWTSGTETIWLTVGRRSGVEQGSPLPSRTGTAVMIGRAHGTIWHGGGPYDVVAIRWALADGRTVEVRTVRDKPAPTSVQDAVAVARAVR